MKRRPETVRVKTRIKDTRRKLHYIEIQRRNILLTDLKTVFVGDDFQWLEKVIRISSEKEHANADSDELISNSLGSVLS